VETAGESRQGAQGNGESSIAKDRLGSGARQQARRRARTRQARRAQHSLRQAGAHVTPAASMPRRAVFSRRDASASQSAELSAFLRARDTDVAAMSRAATQPDTIRHPRCSPRQSDAPRAGMLRMSCRASAHGEDRGRLYATILFAPLSAVACPMRSACQRPVYGSGMLRGNAPGDGALQSVCPGGAVG